MELVFATNNRHKLEEIKLLLNGIYEIKGLKEKGIVEDIPETHETLEENAIEKAMHVYRKYGLNCFADDTGLEVRALNGRPGVYSARYAGQGCTFDDNVNKLLMELGTNPFRKARFRTVIALVEFGKIYTFEGEVKGEITFDKRGNLGFGYDPVFLPEGYGQTFAEMDLILKNRISHRGKAIEKFVDFLKHH